jgi:hypothetical protein
MFFTYRLGNFAILRLKHTGEIWTNDGVWRRVFWRLSYKGKR